MNCIDHLSRRGYNERKQVTIEKVYRTKEENNTMILLTFSAGILDYDYYKTLEEYFPEK